MAREGIDECISDFMNNKKYDMLVIMGIHIKDSIVTRDMCVAISNKDLRDKVSF